MKLLAIVSGRPHGNTHSAAALIAEEAAALAKASDDDFAFEIANLASVDLAFCRGCRRCFEQGEARCPCGDRLLALRDCIAAADALILASPVYVEDVSGGMKNFIDRMAFNCYRPAFAGKTALVFTTSGVGATSRARKTMAAALRFWGFSLSGTYNFRMGARMKYDEMQRQHGKAMRAAAVRLYAAVKSGAVLRPSLYSLIVFTVQQHSWRRKETSSAFTRDYWQQKGWLDPKCVFYAPHKRSRLVQGFARLVGHAIARFFV